MSIIKNNISSSKYYDNDTYKCATDIEQLPIITKYDVINNYGDILVSTKTNMYTETSGSTGTPLRIAWNSQEYLKSLTFLWKLRRSHSIYPTNFFLTCHAGYYVNEDRVADPIVLTNNSLSLSKLWYTEDVMQKYISQIEKFSPKWIFAQPSFVYYLGKYLVSHAPHIASNFQYIELVGELLTDDIKKTIEEVFSNATVVNMYGMQEFNGILYEHDGVMYPLEDNVYVEIINEEGEQCEIGEEGDIVVTGLVNTAFPLIRYNTYDRGKKVQIGDSIGYIVTSGKSNDTFSYNGKVYDGSLFFAVVDMYNRKHKSQIAKFQVIYEDGRLLFNVFSFENLPSCSEISRDIRSILCSIIGVEMYIIVNIQREIQFTNGKNKTKYFICK